jgi:RimJ/RimL family protein N-acetyltransferase
VRVAWGDRDFDQAIADYVVAQFPELSRLGALRPFRAAGFVDNAGQLVGGVVMTDYRFFDAQLSIYAQNPRFVGIHGLRELFGFCFDELGLQRLTCLVGVGNRASRRFVEKAGWKHEGTLRRGLDGVSDAAIYGMTRDDCFWLEKSNDQQPKGT